MSSDAMRFEHLDILRCYAGERVKPVLGDTKILLEIKKEAQAASNLLEGEKNVPKFYAVPNLTVQTSAVSIFDQVPLATMAKPNVKSLCWDWSFPSCLRG